MIRRSPTRIELKLDDIQEFDYVQKYDKKKPSPLVDSSGNISAATAAKMLRHERIGYHRTGSKGSGSAFYTPGPSCNGRSSNDGATTSSQSTVTNATPGVTSTSTPNPIDPADAAATDGAAPTTTSNLDPANLPSDIVAGESSDMELLEINSTYASANMSMDET